MEGGNSNQNKNNSSRINKNSNSDNSSSTNTSSGASNNNSSNSTSARNNNNKGNSSISDTPSTSKNENVENKPSVCSALAPQTAAILKLDIDCFEEAFDYAPLKDLISIGATCKRLLQVAAYIFQQHFWDIEVFCVKNSFLIGYRNRADHFVQVFKNVTLLEKQDLDFYLSLPSKSHRQRQIQLKRIKINDSQLRRLNGIFSKLESLRLHYFEMSGCFYKNMLAKCPNLKHLYIENQKDSIIIGRGNDWLLQKYPTIEHLDLAMRRSFQVAELKDCLELNPNIKHFSTYTMFFWGNRDVIKKTDAKLNDLAVNAIFGGMDFKPFIELLNELYERGFYKRLQFSHNRCNQDLIDLLASASNLVKLYILYGENVRLLALKNLEELYYQDCEGIADLDEVITKNTKLERVHFSTAHPDHISKLVSRAPYLKKIIVNKLMNMKHAQRKEFYYYPTTQPNNTVFNLRALNEQRGKLEVARKVTVYVQEDVYLATKWAINETNFQLVRLMRLGSAGGSYPWD